MDDTGLVVTEGDDDRPGLAGWMQRPRGDVPAFGAGAQHPQRTPPRVLVLNGGSSSGKTQLARALQEMLDGIWLRLGVDTLIEAAPSRLLAGDGLLVGQDGQVSAGAAFSAVEDCWMAGVAQMARSGVGVIIEDSFVSGPCAQARWQRTLGGLPTVWIGVHCAPGIAARREQSRGDRHRGMAASQADAVHRGITYDLEIDTATASPEQLARTLRRAIFTSTTPPEHPPAVP
jgi:chloramphenicol 3-O phosphotransferase